MRGVASFLRWSWIYLWGTVICVAQLLALPFFNPWLDPNRKLADRLNQWWGRGSLWAFPGIHIEVEGLEHVPPGGRASVLCANHVSGADIIMLLASFPGMKFIAKRPLFLTPPIGFSMWLAGYVVAGTPRTLARSLRWLAKGCHVLTFPEGTRSPDGRLLRFQQGSFVLAREGNAPVVPIAISGTRILLPKGSFCFYPRSLVRIRFLAPEQVDDDPKRVASRVRSRIQAALEQEASGGLIPSGDEGLSTSSRRTVSAAESGQ